MLGARRSRTIAASVGVIALIVIALNAGDSGPGSSDDLDDVVSGEPATTSSSSTATSSGQTPNTTSTIAQTTVAPTTQPLRSVTLAFTGDVLLHSRVWRVAAANNRDALRNEAPSDREAANGIDDGYDFTPMFDPVSPWISSADWAVCHMEVNLSADNTRLSSYPIFKGPGAVATDLKQVGYDSCSTASNHALDGRTSSTFETIDVLEGAGLRHTGTARSPEESATSTWIDVDGVRIAHLAYSYWFNGFELPEDQPWAANQINESRILDDAAAARASGADVVMLSLHWGDQYFHRPSQQQADLGPRLLGSPDVDLIIGHHAHVVQPIENIDGEWLVYGLGNMISNQSQQPRRDEILVTVTVTELEDGTFVADRLQVLPLFVDYDTLTIWPSNPDLRTEASSAWLNQALDASFDRVTGVLETGSGWDELELFGS